MAHEILRTSYVGHQYGRWTVLEDAADRIQRNGRHVRYVLCRCACGTTRDVQLGLMRARYSQSCGCATRQAVSRRLRTHGMKGTPEFRAWVNMNYRCHGVQPGGREFAAYRGRGITVCDRWRHSFENFLADMGLRPSPKHSIDRERNDGPYSPNNCRWATAAEQNRNTRGNVTITHDGQTRCISEWALLHGLAVDLLHKRLATGWDFEVAITTPSGAKRNRLREARASEHRRAIANSIGASAALLY